MSALTQAPAAQLDMLTARFGPISAPGEERRPALVDQHSVRPTISSASSTSMARYLTVLSKCAVTKQALYGPQVLRTPAAQRRFGSAQRTGAILLRVAADQADPAVHDPCVLPN